MLFALLMLPNALLAWIFLRQHVTPRFLVGTGIALAGIALLLLHEARLAPVGGKVGLGIAMTAVAVCTPRSPMSCRPRRQRGPCRCWRCSPGRCCGARWRIPSIAWLSVGPPVLPLDARYLGGSPISAIMGSVVTFPLYFQLIRDLGAGRAAYNGVVVPIVAMGLSTVFEGYRWSLLAGSGAALALIGMVVAMRARNPSR